MRAFKKLMAGMIATAIAATLATSAFAAELTEAGKVAVTADEFTAEGQTTVLIVPAAAWESETPLAGLTDADILYIDQYEDAATANAAIVAGFGVKLNSEGTLDEGKYYALFGSKSGDDFTITDVAFEVTNTPDGPVYKFADVNADDAVDANDVTRLLRHTIGIEPLMYETAELLGRCDVNSDDDVDANDVTRLLRHTIGIEPLEGVE